MNGSTGAPRGVVVGGNAVSGTLARLLVGSGYHVDMVDTAVDSVARHVPPGDAVRFVEGDITDPDPALTALIDRADTVVLAVSEEVALAAIDGVAAAMADGALLVDTLAVKSRFVPAVHAAAPHQEVISLNPMFTPSLGVAGRSFAAVMVHDGPRAQDLLRMIGEWGGRVVPVTAAEHDRATAAVQVLPYAVVLAFGLALAGLGVDVAELDAMAMLPYRTLLGLLARIVSGAPEVDWEVQSANPDGSRARSELADALRRLAEMVGSDDQAGFGSAVQHLRDFLGSELEHHREICARMFATIDRARCHP
jgi:prephenate dehydrogenase